MTDCERIRSRLPGCAEGEASPAEALELARHVSRCTGCRILLARERRLLTLLHGLEDPLPADEGLIERLRRVLPARPVAVVRRMADRSRRGLRLVAILIGTGPAAYAVSQRAGWSWNGFGSPWSAPPGPEDADGLVRGLEATVRVLLGIAERIASPAILGVDGPELALWAVGAGLCAAAAAACGAAALAMVARALPVFKGGGRGF